MNQPAARAAGDDDLPAVIELVDGMFIDLGTATTAGWRSEAKRSLASRMWRDVAIFVAESAEDGAPGVLAACAVGILHASLPSPRRAGINVGYIEWVATRATHRRHGYGRAVSAALTEWLTDHGAAVIDLHSSAAAEPLYRSLGFAAQGPAAMRLRTRHSVCQ